MQLLELWDNFEWIGATKNFSGKMIKYLKTHPRWSAFWKWWIKRGPYSSRLGTCNMQWKACSLDFQPKIHVLQSSLLRLIWWMADTQRKCLACLQAMTLFPFWLIFRFKPTTKSLRLSASTTSTLSQYACLDMLISPG